MAYVGIFPNVLLSLHPDYVMTHILTPVAADRTRIDCSWAFAPEAVARRSFDRRTRSTSGPDQPPGLGGLRGVQRGLSSPFASPGPLAGGGRDLLVRDDGGS